MNKEEKGNIIFEVLNAWVYNDVNQAGDKLMIIDAHDLPKIIPEILKKLESSTTQESKEEKECYCDERIICHHCSADESKEEINCVHNLDGLCQFYNQGETTCISILTGRCKAYERV